MSFGQRSRPLPSPVRPFLLAAPLVLASLAARGPAQDPPPAPEAGATAEEESELDKLLRLAREGKAVVRPQAAQRFVALGEPAVERLLAETEGGADALAELGPELAEAMGSLDDPRLRARLWKALRDPDFPWRPQAARGLGTASTAGEAASFVELTSDPLAAVREAAVAALLLLEHDDAAARVRELLADPDDRVRRAAALASFRWGDRCAVAWVVEDLRRDDRYFELQTGKLARYEALKLLEGQLTRRLRMNFGFQPEKTLDDPANAEAARKIEEHVRQLCPELPELPAVARAGSATEGDVLGLEIRSCRKGEHFLRWNVADVLYVGTGNPVAVDLPPGTVARLLEAAAERLEPLGDRRLWGAPGCDMELVHWRTAPDARTTSYRISKGQKAVEGLRPDAIGELERLLIATLPETGEDPRTEDLRARVTEALLAVGGPLAAD